MVETYIRRVLEALESALDTSEQTLITNTAKDPLVALVKLMDTFGSPLFDDGSLTSRIDAIFITHSVPLLRVSTQGVLTWLCHRSKSSDRSQGELQTQAFWTVLLGALALHPTNTALSLLSPLVGASLPAHLRGASLAMDGLVIHLVSSVITAGTQGNEQIVMMGVLGLPGIAIGSRLLGSLLKYRNCRAIHFISLFGPDRFHAPGQRYHFCGGKSEVCWYVRKRARQRPAPG